MVKTQTWTHRGAFTASLVLYLVLIFASAARAEDCSLHLMASLPITEGPNGEILVPVELNGTTELFIVDTDGIYSSVTQATADALHLEQLPLPTGAELYRSDGSRVKQMAVVDTVAVGNTEAKRFHMLVEPNFGGNIKVGGSLGPDLLKMFDLDFDFASKKLNLMSQDHCDGKVVYWTTAYTEVPFKLFGGDHIRVEMTLDGQDVDASIDTAENTTSVSTAYAYRRFELDPKSAGVEQYGDPSNPSYRYHFKSLSLGGIAVTNPLITLMPDVAQAAYRSEHNEKSFTDPIYGNHLDVPELLFGSNILRKLHLYIAYKEHKLYATTVDAH
jgi:hypothetical protein